MLLAHTAEGPVEQRQQSHRRLGDDRSSPAPGQKQADLAAEIARPQRPQDNAVLLDPSRTLEDCEQLVREVALGRDSLIRRDRDLVERVGQRCSNGRRECREARHRLDPRRIDHGATLLRAQL